MTLLYDANGLVIGDDGSPDLGWDSNQLDPNVGIPPAQIASGDVGYFQQKINEFQNVLYSLDAGSYELAQLQTLGLSDADNASIQSLQDEYAGHKAAFKFAAESFNAVSGMVNSAGGSLPSVTIPSGLGFAPLVIPIAWGLAIAGAAVLVSFGLGWLSKASTLSSDVSARYLALANAQPDPTEKTRLLNMGAQAQASADKIQAAQNASGGTIGAVANIVKYIAIAAGVYLIIEMMGKKGR